MALGFLVIDHLFPIELIYTNSVILHTYYNLFSTIAFAEKISVPFCSVPMASTSLVLQRKS